MGRPKKLVPIGDNLNKGKTIKSEKWTQAEMETLASLCLSHGKSGILSKKTNKATNTKKDIQWITVQSVFNSIHPPRNVSALLGRFKFILMHLRKYNARERHNTITTGSRPRPANDDKMPFQVTGPMLELANALGVSFSGLDGFGSHTPNLLNAKDTLPIALTAADKNPTPEIANSFQHRMNEKWENLLNDSVEIYKTEPVNLAQESLSQVELPGIETEAISPNNMALPATPISGQKKSPHKRPMKQKPSSYAKLICYKRKEYLAEKDRRENEKHAAEMHFENTLMEAKLAEMRQIATNRAELHALEMRHKEVLFNHQIQLMIAARNALACSCSSRETLFRSVISLGMENGKL